MVCSQGSPFHFTPLAKSQGEKIPNGHVVTDDFGATFSLSEYDDEPLIQFPALVVCEDDKAPAYETESGAP